MERKERGVGIGINNQHPKQKLTTVDINIDVNELSTYKAACYYASLGLSVIPILPAYKCKDPN
ncbi:MAG: hypothetical protein ACRD5H_00715, partial [Nitrososphaerales archaeon]